MGQLNADMGLDWMGIRVYANFKCLSMPDLHSHFYFSLS
jgi:hypothetical protein